MHLNRFACLAFALILVVLAGCSKKDTTVKQGDFSFKLSDGYSLSDVTSENCDIVRDQDNAIIGGIEVTSLKPKDLNDSDDATAKIMSYLQSEFHKTNNVEFIASFKGETNPIVKIKLTKIADDTSDKSYFDHVFFTKDALVYHMWFDLGVVDQEVADGIISDSVMDGNT